MIQAFLAITALIGAIYALATKQGKIGGGLLVVVAALILSIPSLVPAGFYGDLVGGLSIVLFLAGLLIIVWKKSEKANEKEKKDDQVRSV